MSSKMTDEQAEALSMLLAFLWPHRWLQSERGVWRCIRATQAIVFLGLAALLAVLITLIFAP